MVSVMLYPCMLCVALLMDLFVVHLSLCMLCLFAISMMFVNILLAVCMLVGMVVCAKAIASVVMSYVNCGDDG